jgi:hypothetical protein
MKIRAPRKKKKKAKKLKAFNDSVVMVQAAMIAASGVAQIAIISGTPSGTPALKTLAIAQNLIDSTHTMSECLKQIKPWIAFVPKYKSVKQ